MLYRGPLGGGAASGKIGAMVAARNKGGQYLRARVVPSGSVASAKQQEVRNALASLATAWSSSLTADQRLGWNTYAQNVMVTNRLGDSVQISGENWFIAANTPRLQAGLPVVNDAPTTFDRGTVEFPNLTASIVTGSLSLSFGGTVTAAARVLVYQGQPFSAGRGKYYGSNQYAGSIDITAGKTGSLLTPVLPLAGTDSQQTATLVVTRDDGRLATPLSVTFPGA